MKDRMLFTAAIISLAAVLFACGSGPNATFTGSTVTRAALVSIAITPSNPSIGFGKSEQFTATGTFADKTTRDLTASVIWSSSTTSVANISNITGSNGVAILLAVGTTTITATDPVTNILGNTLLSVTPAAALHIVNVNAPAIGIDDSDNIFAVWSASTSSTYPNYAYAYASRHSLSGWDTPVFIGDTDLGMITFFRLAVSPNGSAYAVWYKSTGNLYINRYVPGNGWGSPEVLFGPSTILDLQAAADGNGNLIVVWEAPTIPYYRLYAQKYVPGIGWNTAQAIDDNTGTCSYPRLVADNTGDVIAIWQQSSTRVYANQLTAVSSWGTPTIVSSSTSTGAYAPEIAINKSGSAMAVWYENNNGTYNAYARSFTPSIGWDAVQSIETGTSGAYEVHVAIDDVGTAIALWRQPDLYYNRYVPGSGWDTAQAFAVGSSPEVKMNGQGQAVAVWNQWDPSNGNQVYSKKFIPATGWGAASNLVSELGSANSPHAVMDSQGNATAIWSQWASPTTCDLYTKTY